MPRIAGRCVVGEYELELVEVVCHRSGDGGLDLQVVEDRADGRAASNRPRVHCPLRRCWRLHSHQRSNQNDGQRGTDEEDGDIVCTGVSVVCVPELENIVSFRDTCPS